MALVPAISICLHAPKAIAQSDKYSKMAPVGQYLMERNAEILLARSAAPDSISSDATILVLGRQGYETAVRGKNGFVCMVERSWMEAFDLPEFWNPKVRGAECLNRQAARSILPIADLRTRLVMVGHSKAQIVSAIKAAFEKKQLPDLENGAMAFMMSKSAYLFDAGDHNGPHVMFFTSLVLTGSYRRRNRPRRKDCRRFSCSQSKLQSGPTERSHPCCLRAHAEKTRGLLYGPGHSIFLIATDGCSWCLFTARIGAAGLMTLHCSRTIRRTVRARSGSRTFGQLVYAAAR
jgi:hypothetical protein